MAPRIVVVDYGMGNIHSILKALRLYSKNVSFTGDPEAIRQADALVLPGDGAFSAAMRGLSGGRKEALLEAVQKGRPLLGICIGFQILFSDSDEDGPCEGLGLLPGRIHRFSFADKSVRIPHMGWNRLEFSKEEKADKKPTYVYFIHSYRAEAVPASLVLARANYAGDLFPAIVEKDNILAMQFHPEKSDAPGLSMLETWVRGI